MPPGSREGPRQDRHHPLSHHGEPEAVHTGRSAGRAVLANVLFSYELVSAKRSYDEDVSARLWQVSAELVGLAA